MLTVDQFIKAYRKECLICINLYSKIPVGGLDYRPSPGQRSTLELLRYLSYGPYNVVRRIVHGDWSLGVPSNEATKDMPATDFVDRMNWHMDEVARLVRSVPLTNLQTEMMTFPWGTTKSKAEALVDYPFKWITGYKLQLFVYLKAAGAKELGTADAWRHPFNVE